MITKRTVLFLLSSFISILSHAQGDLCDSTVNMCPDIVDYYVGQDIKARELQAENINLKAGIANLKYRLDQSEVLFKKTSDNLLIANEENSMLNTTIEIQDKLMGKQARQITGLKIGCFAIGVVGIITTTYFIIK